MHVRTDVERDAELRAELTNGWAEISRARDRGGCGRFVEQREAAVSDELDDPATVIFDAGGRGGVEAVDELGELRWIRAVRPHG